MTDYRNHAWRHHPLKGTDPLVGGGELLWFMLYTPDVDAFDVFQPPSPANNIFSLFTHWRSNHPTAFKPVSYYDGGTGGSADDTTPPWSFLRLLEPGAYIASFWVRFQDLSGDGAAPFTFTLMWDDYSANFVDVPPRDTLVGTVDDYWFARQIAFLTGDVDPGDGTNVGYVRTEYSMNALTTVDSCALFVAKVSGANESSNDRTTWP